jgi:hypothetical protein
MKVESRGPESRAGALSFCKLLKQAFCDSCKQPRPLLQTYNLEELNLVGKNVESKRIL